MSITIREINNLMQRYLHPKIGVGTPVRYYPNADHNEKRATCGFVMKVGNASLTLFIPGSRSVIDAVKHVSDPRLLGASEHRESGSWDFTEQQIADETAVSELMSMISPTEEDRKNPQRSAAVKEVWSIRQEAAAMGARNVKAMSRKECEQFIARQKAIIQGQEQEQLAASASHDQI